MWLSSIRNSNSGPTIAVCWEQEVISQLPGIESSTLSFKALQRLDDNSKHTGECLYRRPCVVILNNPYFPWELIPTEVIGYDFLLNSVRDGCSKKRRKRNQLQAMPRRQFRELIAFCRQFPFRTYLRIVNKCIYFYSRSVNVTWSVLKQFIMSALVTWPVDAHANDIHEARTCCWAVFSRKKGN